MKLSTIILMKIIVVAFFYLNKNVFKKISCFQIISYINDYNKTNFILELINLMQVLFIIYKIHTLIILMNLLLKTKLFI